MHADRQTCFCRFGFWRFRLHTFCHFRWHSSQSPKSMLQICKSSQGVYSVSAKHKLKWTVFLQWTLQLLFIVTARNEVWGKVIFLHLSFCSHGGGLPQGMLGYPPTPPLGPDPPLRDHTPEQTPPGTRQPHNLQSACWEIRSTNGRYASYWNAFLLI